MRSALDHYHHHADRLPPEAKPILAAMSDNVVLLAFDAYKAACEELAELEPNLGNDECRARENLLARARLRREVPQLTALSDADLDVVIAVSVSAAIDPDLDREK